MTAKLRKFVPWPQDLRVRARIMLAAVMLCASLIPRDAASICDAIPSAATRYRGALGSIDRPFASPGTAVTIDLDGSCSTGLPGFCPAPGCGADAASSIAVTVLFTPPAGERNGIVLARDCAALAPELARCSAAAGVGTVRCVPLDRTGNLPPRVTVRSPRQLEFIFPDTDIDLAPDTDDLTFTGPAAIAVSRIGTPLPCGVTSSPCGSQPGPIACIDALFARDGTCEAIEDRVFPHFTALPPPNDFSAVCATPNSQCTGRTNELRLTVDSAGNLLIPMDFSGVLPDTGLPIAGLVRGTTTVEAFSGRSVPIALLSSQDPTALASFSLSGALLDPRFEPKTDARRSDGLTLFGTIDAERAVLRIARAVPTNQCEGGTDAGLPCSGGCPSAACNAPRCNGGARDGLACEAVTDCPRGECGPGLFEFRDRLFANVGPILIGSECAPGVNCALLEAETLGASPLDASFEGTTIDATLVPEGLEDRDLNGDGDATDHVVQVRDRRSGDVRPIGRNATASGWAGLRLRRPPFFLPGLAMSGDVFAFLEPEPLEGDPAREIVDKNRDGDTFDTILRVFRTDNGAVREVTASLLGPVAVDAEPVINGRSIAVVGSNVVYRRSEASSVRKTTRGVSLANSGNGANRDTYFPSITPDGRFVVFVTDAGNLVAGDRNESGDVFIRDRVLKKTELISVDASGRPTGGALEEPVKYTPVLTPDGRYVAFTSHGLGDTTNDNQVFIRDRASRTTEVVSVGADGNPGNGIVSWGPAISADGKFVAYTSDASNLVVGDTNDECDVFVRDRFAGTTVRVSVASTGEQGNGASCFGRIDISSDGNVVVFSSDASNLVNDDTNDRSDVFVHDRVTGETTRASVTSRGTQGSGESFGPSISAHGRDVTFTSCANDLVAGDTNDFACDYFLHDRVTKVTTRVSVGSDGRQATGEMVVGSDVSPDGRYVAFVGVSTELVPGTAGGAEVFVHDVLTGLTDVASVFSDGTPGNAGELDSDELMVSVSDKGHTVAMASVQDNLDLSYRGGLGVYVREADDTDRASDLTGDGDFADTVLEVLDTSVGRVRTLCPASRVAAAAGSIAFLRPEQSGAARNCPSGSDLNGDGDTKDEVVHIVRGTGTVSNLRRAATDLAASDRVVAALIAEAAEHGRDRNGDGDTSDTVLEVHDVARTPGSWVGVGQASDAVAVSGAIVAFVTPEPAQGTRTLNGDGDAADRVLQYYDIDRDIVVNVGQAVEDFVLRGHLIAFRTPERAQGADLNCDRDLDDTVLQVFDVASRRLVNTRQAAINCSAEQQTCDPLVPYRVLGDTVRFITPEAAQGADLDQNGSFGLVKQIFNVRADAPTCAGGVPSAESTVAQHVLAAVATGICTDTGEGCGSDDDCPEATCYRPPGVCVKDLERNCELSVRDPVCPPMVCEPCRREVDEFCVAIPGVTTHGTCHVQVGAEGCATDADCTTRDPGAVCRDVDAVVQLPVNPFIEAGTGVTFTSAGRCSGADASGEACVTDADCAEGATCSGAPVVVTAADRDGDELPDPFDNCPDVANIEQSDTDSDGVGDACDRRPACGDGTIDAGEQCDDGNQIGGDGCDSGCSSDGPPPSPVGCRVSFDGRCGGAACPTAGAVIGLRDDDRDGRCEWPAGSTTVSGALSFASGTTVEMSGATAITAMAIHVATGASLFADGTAMTRLALTARGGDLIVDGALAIAATDDIVLTAKQGNLSLRGTLALTATDRVVLSAKVGSIELAPSPAMTFAVHAGNRIEITAPGASGSVEIRHARIGSKQVRVITRTSTAASTAKAVRISDGALLTTDPQPSGGPASSGDVVVDATGDVFVAGRAVLDASRNVRIVTARNSDDVCLSAGARLEARDARGKLGELDMAQVKGRAFRDATVVIEAIVRGAVIAGACSP